MMSWILNFVNRVSDSFLKRTSRNLDRKEMNEGKTAPKKNKVVIYTIIAFFIAIVVGLALRHNQNKASFSSYKTEREVKFSASRGLEVYQENERRINDSQDLETRRRRENSDIDILRRSNNTAGQGIRARGASTPSSPESVISTGRVPNKFECSELVGKVSRGEDLNDGQKEDLQACLESNVMGLDADQLKALSEILSNPELSSEARKILAQMVNGELDVNSDEYKLAQALISDDPAMRRLANALLDPNLSAEDKAVLMGMLRSGVIDEAKLKAIEAKLERERERKGAPSPSNPLVGITSSKGSVVKGLDSQDLKDLAGKVSVEKEELGRINREIADLSAELAKEMAENPNSERAKELISKLAVLNTRANVLKKSLELGNKRLAEMYEGFNKELKIAEGLINKQTTSYELEFDQIPNYKEVNLRKLTADQLRILGMLNDNEGSREGSDFNNRRIMNVEGASSGSLLVYSRTGSTENVLNPSSPLKIVNSDEILVSDKNFQGNPVRLTLKQDAHALDNGKVLIPKGSMIFGKISALDFNTKTITVQMDRAQVGNKIIPINITTNIRGEVLDTRGREITSAVLLDFVSAITDNYRKTAEDEFSLNKTPTIMDATTNGVAGGISTSMEKLAQLFADDLKNASKIFYLPANYRMVIYP